VKQEVPEPSRSSKDPDRQAKIKALAAQIRAKARRAAEEEDAEVEPEEAPRMPPDEQDTTRLEGMIQGLDQKVAHTEDEIERIGILAAPLSMEVTEDIKELQANAIRDTERAVRAAKLNFDSALRDVDRAEREVAALAAPDQAQFSASLAQLKERLQEAQGKLEDHKNVRRDYEQAAQAGKAFGDLASRLSTVEMDCDKAAIMAEPVAKTLDTNPLELSAADLRETKEAVRIAQAKLAPIARLITAKASGLRGLMLERMTELQARAQSCQAQLDKAQQTMDEAQSRASALPLLKQASERLAAVEEILEKMRETEAPFLMGIENLPPEEAKPALDKMDKAASLALSAVADAHKYVSLKLVEVGRLAEATAATARAELEKVKKQLDANAERVRKFQLDATGRRKNHVVFSMKEHVEAADVSVQRMQSLAGVLRKATIEKMTECLEQAHAAELEAQSAVALARREVQERQPEVHGPNGGRQQAALKNNSEVLRCKVRVSHMEAELAKFRKLAKEAGEKIKVFSSLREICEDVNQAEEEAERLSAAAQHWGQKPPEEDDRALAALKTTVSNVTAEVEQKLQASQGLELKELRSVFGRIQKIQKAVDGIKETVQERSRSQCLGKVKEAAGALAQMEKKLASLVAAASKPGEQPIERLPELLKEAKSVSEEAAKVQSLIHSSQKLQLTLDAKVEFARLQVRCKAADRKAKATLNAVSSSYQQLTSEACNSVLAAFRLAARRGEGNLYQPEQLFDELAEGSEEVNQRQLTDFFARYGLECGLSDEKVPVALKMLAPYGLTRRAFVAVLSDYQRVARDISITDSFEIQSSEVQKVRKLQVGELLEIQGAIQKDDSLGLERVRCKALVDGASGWVTVRAKNGVEYLTAAKKPYLWCAEELPLRSQRSSDEVIRQLVPGECLELVEGPKEEKIGKERRLRGVACGDETSGWLQVESASGEVVAKEGTNVYKCVTAIAMTDAADFANCNMLRRIDVGEALELMGDEVHEGEGSKRQRFRACKDGTEGWVTTAGNQGTSYLKQVKRHYICLRPCPIHAGLSAVSGVHKVLMAGEAFRAFEDPKDVKGGEQRTSYKARAAKDGVEGWITVSAEEVVPWSPIYKVLRAAPLTHALQNEAAEANEVLRVLTPGELVEAIGPPQEDPSTGQLRLRAVAKSDMSVGWVTAGDSDGSGMALRPATAGESEVVEEAEDEGAETWVAPTKLNTKQQGKGKAWGKRPWQVKEEEDSSNWSSWGASNTRDWRKKGRRW